MFLLQQRDSVSNQGLAERHRTIATNLVQHLLEYRYQFEERASVA